MIKRKFLNPFGEPGKYPGLKPLQKAFLAAYEVCGCIEKAARAAKVRRTMHKSWMKSAKYRRAFARAEDVAGDNLRHEAHRRAVQGCVEYKYYRGKPIIHPVTGEHYYELKRSDELLIEDA